MTRKEQRPGVNSTTAAVAAFKSAAEVIDPPEGIELESDAERIVWRQFVKARISEDWRELDLVLLSKIVKLEVQIREYQALLKGQATIPNKRGTMVQNPLFTVVDTLQKQQLAIIRSLALNQTASDQRTVSRNAKMQAEIRAIDSGLDDDLLAAPK